eukprot:gene6358-7086_t
MNIEQRPKVLLFDFCSHSTPDYVLRGILGENYVEEEVGQNENIREHVMKIDNKYYTASISLLSISPQRHANEIFSDLLPHTEAVIVLFDMRNDSVFDKVKEFERKMEDFDIEVKLLLSNEAERCNELNNKRTDVVKWCIEKSFEFVELYQTDDNEEFPEKFGFERIREALHTHMWPNMLEKSRFGAENGTHKDGICNGGEEPSASNLSVEAKNNLENISDPIAVGTESEGESFEEMFSKLNEMKLQADSLSGDERKLFAETMAIAFWKAMGQDDDEISGL